MENIIFYRSKTNSIKIKKLLSIICVPYLYLKGSYVGSNAKFANRPIFPHGITGVFISGGAKIGNNCVIFHQVTIGSNTLNGSIKYGSPTIGNNVYIGAGAKIIGKVTIGDNCRIGANCVVCKDVPSNSTVVSQSARVIEKSVQYNTFEKLNLENEL